MKLSDYALIPRRQLQNTMELVDIGIIKGRQLPQTAKLISELQANGDNETC